ncbi:MAG: lactonase family protein [Prolixibacteraceae bacterium]|jgi:6-phosphogluconolactonase|nr:lactonase family protein [Prolixibacteraceae bacterium]
MLKLLLVLAVMICNNPSSNDNKDNLSTKSKQKDKEISTADRSTKYPFYIGTYTDSESEGIYLSFFDADAGTISSPKLVTKLENATFQNLSKDKNSLLSVSQNKDGIGDTHEYTINEDFTLRLKNIYKNDGVGSCYVSYHDDSESVLVANYRSGNVTRTTKTAGFSNQHSGTGPNANRQEKPHAHCIKIDLQSKFAYSCDLGADKIYVYNLQKGGLNPVTEIKTALGAGPRHVDFHPDEEIMAVVNELNSSIEVFKADKNGLFTKRIHTVSTIPKSHTSNNQCADIHFSDDGKYLYASNRGHNSIAVFKMNQKMKPELIQLMDQTISWPRNFSLSPDGKFMLVANKNSNCITLYRVDKNTGKLTYTKQRINISKPVCITFPDSTPQTR